MTIKPLVPPTLNLNGTSSRELVLQHAKVLYALVALQRTMAEASPHGRDYQTKPGEYVSAREAWLQRMQIVSKLTAEVEDYAADVLKQADARRKAS